MQDVEIKRGIMDRIAWKQEEFIDKGGKEDTCPTRQQEALLEELAHLAGCEMIWYKNLINDRILFATFTRNLAADMRENLTKICPQ